MARKALVDGLVRYDEAHGWHGTVKSIDLGQDWGVPLGDIPEYGDIKPWRLAVVLDVSDTALRIGLQPEHDKSGALSSARETGTVGLDGMKWTGKKPKALAKPGDVVYVEPHRRQGRRIPPAADSGGFRRLRGDGSVHRPRAGDGRRLLLRPFRVQPRHPGAAPARFVVQADRLRRGARQRLHAVVDRARRADLDRPGQRRNLDAAELRGQVGRTAHACASASSTRSTR